MAEPPAPTLVTGSGGASLFVEQELAQMVADAVRIVASLHDMLMPPATTVFGDIPFSVQVAEVTVQDNAGACTVTLTAFDGMPLATTTRVLAPVSMPAGISNWAETEVVPVAIPMVLKVCVLQ